MRVMLLAAGRGTRLAPWTNTTPKPLFHVGGESLLSHHIRRFVAAGFKQIVINLHHLPQQIKDTIGDGGAFGAEIIYSPEEQLLGTAGGIRLAIARGFLPQPFALANGDIMCDYDVQSFKQAPTAGAHLLLVPNPADKANGDFSLYRSQLIHADETIPRYTYAGMGVYNPALFESLAVGRPHELLPVLQQAIDNRCASAELYNGAWYDIGTPEGLAAARRHFGR